MTEIRFNYGDKFTQTTNTNTGIGSTIPAAKLDIAGGTSAGSLRVSGIASLSSYQGFVNTKLSTTEDLIVEAGQSGSVSGEVVIGTGQTISVSTAATTGQGGIQSLKVSQTFMPPVGGTADRPTDVKPGMVYYNKDFKTIEFWDGNFWKQVDNTTRRGRGLIHGGKSTPTWTSSVEFIETATQGNAKDFGDLTQARGYPNCTSDGTRGIAAGGAIYPAGPTTFSNTIDYNTIASEGNSIDFGDAQGGTSPGLWGDGACASSTRAVLGSWSNVSTNIDYIQMQTLGNSLDFGDKSGGAIAGGVAGVSSPTRGVWGGGYFPYNSPVAGYNSKDIIEFITIANKGNTTDFGTLTRRKNAAGGASNSVRGVFAAGYEYQGSANPSGETNSIDYITIASTGNAIEFGQLMSKRSHGSAMGTGIRGIFAGMGGSPSLLNIVDFITFSSTGNAEDFGDLSEKRREGGCATDSHGGLGGF
jgi:hypothetical protein